LKAKADPNMKVNNKTPIEWCAENNLPHIIHILQKYGGDISICDDTGHGNALHLACYKGNAEVIDYLLSQNISIE
jgi:ankyrin repeat protein